MSRYCAKMGAAFWSYVRTMRTLQDVPLDDGFELATFPEAWLGHYRLRSCFAIDPTTAAARHATHPLHWFEVGALVRLGREQLEFLDDARAFGITDGLAVPVFSAHGTDAYFGVGTDRGVWRLTDAARLEVALACQAVHQRAMRWMVTRTRAPAPSPRVRPKCWHWWRGATAMAGSARGSGYPSAPSRACWGGCLPSWT